MLGWLFRTLGLVIMVGMNPSMAWGQTQPTTPPAASQPATSRPAYRADSPAQWLSTRGKGERWIEATDPSRALLDRLDLRAPKVKAYLPNLRRQCEMIQRVDAFNWKTITAVEFLQNALEDLSAGKVPNTRYAGRGFGFAYWSERMQRIEAVWVHVPPKYDPDKPYQLFLYYKSGGGIHNSKGKAAGGYRPTAEMANKTETFHAWSSLNIQVKGRMGVEIELEEFPAALAREFSVKPDRVFLTGYSDGGFTALWLATHYPHLVAGIAPNCANWQYTNVEQVNLRNVPYLVVDGWGDGGYAEGNFLRFQSLSNMGYDASALFGQHGHSYAPYEDEETFAQILDWAKTKERDLWPRHVRYVTWNLTWNRAYWVSIERAIEPCLTSQIDVEVEDGNRIEVQTHNVAAYTLQLDGRLVDPSKPLVVTTEGKESYRGPHKNELQIELTPRPSGMFVKDAAMPDEITAQVAASTYDGTPVPDRRWLAVRGTAGDEETATLLAKWYPQGATADAYVTEDDIARCNLVLYGGPGINKLTARIAQDLPVKFGDGSFTIGETTYAEPTNCVAFIHPNPLNPRRYVIVLAFNDAAVFAQHKHFDLGEAISAWKFRTGDCVVAGISAGRAGQGSKADQAGYRQRHIVFDAAWQPDSRIVGKLATALNRSQILRLRAAAIREAAGTDVGVIWQDTPEYQQWSDGLPAGPVTLANLATIDMLPEYVMVGEMMGSQLARLRPAASTIVRDEADPWQRAGGSLRIEQIEPEKVYRVAMGYWGIPAYRAEPKRMPKLFRFGSESEFVANENVGVFVQGLRQTPIEMTEAVARYIRKRGTIATQPVSQPR
jgi:predicted esterase